MRTIVIVAGLLAFFFGLSSTGGTGEGKSETNPANGAENSANPNEMPSPPVVLTVITANIHVAAGVPPMPAEGLPAARIRASLDRIAVLLREHDPDLIFLQEVDFASRRSGYIDQGAYLAEKLSMHPVPAVTFDTTGHTGKLPDVLKDCRYGLALLCRLKPRLTQVKMLPAANASQAAWREDRAMILAESPRGGSGSLLFVGTHLDFQSAEARRRQLAAIAGELRGPFILGGDFNHPAVWPTAGDPEETARLSKLHDWRPAEGDAPSFWSPIPGFSPDSLNRVPTYPAARPRAAIDQIFAGNGARVLETRVLDSRGESDHHFVLARVALPAGR